MLFHAWHSASAFQGRAHHRQQAVWINGLSQERGSLSQSLQMFSSLGSITRNDYHFQIRVILLDCANQFKPAETWHDHVGDKHVNALAFRAPHFKRFFAVCAGDHFHAVFFQHHAQVIPHGRLVLGQ